MSDDTIYMERRAFEFFRAFPDVPEPLRPVYSRFYDTGLLWTDPNADDGDQWPGALRWTEAGRALRDAYDENFPNGQINFFRVSQICELLPSGDLGEAERRIFKTELPGQVPPMGHPQSPSGGLKVALLGMSMAVDALGVSMRRRIRT